MQKIRYRLIWNRLKRLNTQGKALVQCECSLFGRKIYITTRVYLRENEWDKNLSQVSDIHPNQKNLNAYLFEFMHNLEGIEMDIWRRGGVPTLQHLKDAVKQDRQRNMTFDSFARYTIEASSRKRGTKSNLMNTLKMMKRFKSSYDWDDLTYTFLRDFENWLRDKGDSINTIGKHLTQLRTLINEAVKNGYMASNPFSKFKIKHEKGAHSFLTPDEFKEVENLQLDNKKGQHVLDAFLFCCYTGLRFSDFKSLRKEFIVNREGEVWLAFNSQKTGVKTELPLYLLGGGRAADLLNKYSSVERLAHIGCNADVNRKLRAIFDKVHIKKKVTFHSARHTCATMLVYNEVPITSVQRVLGHTKVSTTQIYSEVHNQTLIKDLSKLVCNNKCTSSV